MKQKIAIKQLNELKKLGRPLRLAAEWSKPWQSLIATILSARTRDDKTISVCKVLFKKYESIRALSRADGRRVAGIIKPVNFYKTKTKNIINCAKAVADNYNGRVPREFDKLIELPGVGRKTANVFLAHQGGAHIGVDTHVFYISHKLGWTNSGKPEGVERDLERIFPKSRWRDINYILVRFGQSYRSKREKDALLNKIKNIK